MKNKILTYDVHNLYTFREYPVTFRQLSNAESLRVCMDEDLYMQIGKEIYMAQYMKKPNKVMS